MTVATVYINGISHEISRHNLLSEQDLKRFPDCIKFHELNQYYIVKDDQLTGTFNLLVMDNDRYLGMRFANLNDNLVSILENIWISREL